MNLRKHLAGLAIFLAIFGSTVLIFNYLTSPMVTVHTGNPIPLSTQPATPVELSYEVQYASLDFINRKSYVELAFNLKESSRRAPRKLWVRTYFFAPHYDGQRVWSSEVTELRSPFMDGDRYELSSVASCDWCSDSSVPKAGYYARVIVSTRSADDTYLSDSEINREITTATPVVVQAERKSRF
jgi:hypothetical protein